jgi:hypothetical protein
MSQCTLGTIIIKKKKDKKKKKTEWKTEFYLNDKMFFPIECHLVICGQKLRK